MATDTVSSCGRCGYRTTGLSTDRCPECGFDLARKPYLRWADRGWLRTLVAGAVLMRIGAVGAVVAALLRIAHGELVNADRIPAFARGLPLKTVCTTFFFAFLLVAAMGVWFIATPDPTRSSERSGGAQRLLCRCGIVILVVLAMTRASIPHLLHPVLVACVSVTCLLTAFVVLWSLDGVVCVLLARCQTECEDQRRPAGRDRWLLGAIVAFVAVFGLSVFLASRRGMAAAGSIDFLATRFGTLPALVSLARFAASSRAIRNELGKSTW